jgi:predicted dehydrogenase
LAERFAATAFEDWQVMLEQPLDLLVIALPHALHVAPALAAAAKGIHILMEKPIATTLEDAHTIVDACTNAGVLLTISFVHRFREEVKQAKSWLETGELGTPQLARSVMNGQRGAHLPAWVTQRNLSGGGVLMYSAIHEVDRLRWLLGQEVTRVHAHTHHYDPASEVEDSVTALLEFTGGSTATLTTSAPSYPSLPLWETEIVGDKGILLVQTRHYAALSNAHTHNTLDTQQIAQEQGIHYNFARQAQAFADAILERAALGVTAEDGLKALEVALAIYASAEQHQPVTL